VRIAFIVASDSPSTSTTRCEDTLPSKRVVVACAALRDAGRVRQFSGLQDRTGR
jgi:hypothetical protein